MGAVSRQARPGCRDGREISGAAMTKPTRSYRVARFDDQGRMLRSMKGRNALALKRGLNPECADVQRFYYELVRTVEELEWTTEEIRWACDRTDEWNLPVKWPHEVDPDAEALNYMATVSKITGETAAE